MSIPQFDHPSAAPLPRAMTTSGRWITSTDADSDGAPVTAATVPDLRQAAALLEAATRMHDSSDPQTLLHLIAGEALSLLPGDGVVVLAHGRNGPTPVIHLPRAGVEADPSTTTMLCLRLGAAHLLEPGQVTDLDDHLALLGAGNGSLELRRWRSLLVADLDSSRSSRPTRLLWYATTADAFALAGDLAVLFAGHAGLALQTVSERHHLERAVDARTVTAQATGILMNRHRITAERAFGIMRRYSQEHNIKLRAVAENINHTGGLPG